MEAFIKAEYRRSDMCAVEVDAMFVDRFSDFLFTTYKISNNHVQKIMQVFKHVTKICIKRLKSEIWMQGYYTQEKDRHIELPEFALKIFADELVLQCRPFMEQYTPTKDRELLIFHCGIRETVAGYLKCRWSL